MGETTIPGSRDIAANKTRKVHDLKTIQKPSLPSYLHRVYPWMLRHVLFSSTFDEISLKSRFILRIVHKAVFALKLDRCLLKV